MEGSGSNGSMPKQCRRSRGAAMSRPNLAAAARLAQLSGPLP